MTNESVPNHQQDATTAPQTKQHGGHGWMMMICCVPMVAIAIALVAAGVASPSFLLAAGACARDDGLDDARHGSRRRS